MRKIGKKIYYDKITGDIILTTSERIGNVRETTTEEDFQTYQALKERVPDTVGIIQLEYGQYSQDFIECNGYRVNLETMQLEFSYPDPNTPPEEQEIVYQNPLSEELKEAKLRITDLELIMADMISL
ncbi:hypothetical protein DW1_1158 [Proteiniborus sp. DW1]|uniref:hypothetical protein n=1 Tax=Proteiniborus sp. DW1 TaxID=1889883 RepID=UPI00092E04C4|nr:hypothetical protein [Proteiniborus sp. DW1]SCG82731.1 hypothetical protein DW1_1158 [Proteiniborus sp. DW1]